MAIFVSHSSHDKTWVRQLVNDLRDDDLPVWFDEDCILPGDSIPEAVAEALEESKAVLIVLSKNSVTSGWVKDETSGALYRHLKDKGCRVIPVLRESCDPPPMLAHRKHFDLTAYGTALPKLLEFLHNLSEVKNAPQVQIPHYKSFRTLGEGSSGIVYECIDARTSQKCALKLAKSPFIPLNVEKSVHDKLAASSYVVPIIDSGTWHKRAYIVMPYVGRSLKWHLRHGKIRREQVEGVLDIAEGILRGLDEAHAAGVIHCDIKPSNILLDDLGRPILCDFGISRDIPNVHLTFSTVIRGTICYMSPEQQLAQSLNEQTDIYSFGSLLYEMLTGAKPVGRFKDASALNPKVFPKLESIINKCLEADQEHRYEQCKQVLADLDSARNEIKVGQKLRQLRASEMPLFCASSAMKDILGKLARISASDADLLLIGPVGCGKTMLAKWSHDHSPRRRFPFVPVNAPSIPTTLAVAELFGHERGAFTGATGSRRGLLEQANGGTLFMDEVSDLPLEVQTYLLRVLETGSFQRIGSGHTVSVDVRWLFASNRNLEELAERGLFRRDLLSRIAFTLHVPPLSERREEIVPLATEIAARLGYSLSVEPEAAHLLVSHSWPGNVRELITLIQHEVVERAGEDKEMSISVASLSRAGLLRSMAERVQSDSIAFPEGLYQMPHSEAVRHAEKLFENVYFSRKLQEAGGSITDAARASGVDLQTFRKKLEAIGRNLVTRTP